MQLCGVIINGKLMEIYEEPWITPGSLDENARKYNVTVQEVYLIVRESEQEIIDEYHRIFGGKS